MKQNILIIDNKKQNKENEFKSFKVIKDIGKIKKIKNFWKKEKDSNLFFIFLLLYNCDKGKMIKEERLLNTDKSTRYIINNNKFL